MAKFELIAGHPLSERPYGKIRFVGTNGQGLPVYDVEGAEKGRLGAASAISAAFHIHGGLCFYCRREMNAQPLAARGPHRDHVRAKARGGSSLIHNYVVACGDCGSSKGAQPVSEFRGEAADRWLAALEDHIARALRTPSP